MHHADAVTRAAYCNHALNDDDAFGGDRSNKTSFNIRSSAAEVKTVVPGKRKADGLSLPTRVSSGPLSSAVMTCTWTQVFPAPSTKPTESNPCGSITGDAASVPCRRVKHAACMHRGCLYVHGGRNGSQPLRDFWRFHIGSQKWISIECSNCVGDPPGHLEGHTLVSRDEDGCGSWADDCTGSLYMFGGELGFCYEKETSLWTYNVGSGMWIKETPSTASAEAGAPEVPAGRRGHTAVVYRQAMHIFGGYLDFSGSTNDLWTYDFGTQSWQLIHGTTGARRGRCTGGSPAARHDHSAAVCVDSMLVYGGMANLVPCTDLWQWSFNVHCWTKVQMSPLTRRAPAHLRLALHVDHRVMLLSSDEDSAVLNDEQSVITPWQLNVSEGTLQKCKQLTGQSSVLVPALAQYVIVSQQSRCHCTRTARHCDRSRMITVERQEQPTRLLAAGDGTVAAQRTLRNRVAPTHPLSDGLPECRSGSAARHRIAFQSDASIFSACRRSTDCLITLPKEQSKPLGLTNRGFKWPSDTSGTCLGWLDSLMELSMPSLSLKVAVSPDHKELAEAYQRQAPVEKATRIKDKACPVRSSSLFHLPGTVAIAKFNPTLRQSSFDSETDVAMRLYWASSSDVQASFMSAPDEGDGCRKSITQCLPPAVEFNAAHSCSTELYIVGGKTLHGRDAGTLNASTAMLQPLTIWRCCLTGTT